MRTSEHIDKIARRWSAQSGIKAAIKTLRTPLPQFVRGLWRDRRCVPRIAYQERYRGDPVSRR